MSMAADTRASSSVDDLIVPVVTGNGKQLKMRGDAPGDHTGRGQRGMLMELLGNRGAYPQLYIWLCSIHISAETDRVPFDPPRSSLRLITTFQQSTSIGRSLDVTPSIRGMQTRRQDNIQSPLSSFPGRQASFRLHDPVGGMPQLHNQVAPGISIGPTMQDY